MGFLNVLQKIINFKMVGTILGSSVEYQALLAEIKQKDKQREELLMNLKVRLYVALSLLYYRYFFADKLYVIPALFMNLPYKHF